VPEPSVDSREAGDRIAVEEACGDIFREREEDGKGTDINRAAVLVFGSVSEQSDASPALHAALRCDAASVFSAGRHAGKASNPRTRYRW
jgi:hypothetical protein